MFGWGKHKKHHHHPHPPPPKLPAVVEWIEDTVKYTS